MFEDATKGGVVPREYIPSVEKGLREAMGTGVLAGYPVVDVKATLTLVRIMTSTPPKWLSVWRRFSALRKGREKRTR